MCAKPENVCAYIEDYIDNHYSGLWPQLRDRDVTLVKLFLNLQFVDRMYLWHFFNLIHFKGIM